MSERLYYNNSYLFEFEAIVKTVAKKDSYFEIVLDQTAFYPESGGQNYDIGIIDKKKVIGVFVDDNDNIIHHCEQWDADAGQRVKGKIDKERRIANMTKHTAQHILSQSFLRVAAAETVGAHLGDTESTIELSTLRLTSEHLRAAEEKANEIILQNLSVCITYSEHEKLAELGVRRIPERSGKFRLVGIGDFELTACGGTHCGFTGEIGLLKIVGVEKIRKNTRITFLCGEEATTDYHNKNKVIDKLSKRFTCHYSNLENSVAKLIDYNENLKREIGFLQKEMFPFQLQKLKDDADEIAGIKIISKIYSNYDFKNLKDIAMNITKEIKAIVLFSLDDKLIISVSDGINKNASFLTKIFVKNFGGRGGGNPVIAQIGGIPAGAIDLNLMKFTELIKIELDQDQP